MEKYTCMGCCIMDICFKRNKHKVYKKDLCPCRICLVKAMCQEACDDYRDIWRGSQV
jgi:hypothetical protein